jgi:hypothetical protein
MKDLENHHTQELIRFEKAVKIQCKNEYNIATASFSKAMSMSRALQSMQNKN